MHDVSRMKHANDIAHRRDREGLQIQNDHIDEDGTNSKNSSSNSDSNSNSNSNDTNTHQQQKSSPALAATTRNPPLS